MAKRAALRLEAIDEPASAPEAPRGAGGGPEPMTVVYARVPWTLGEQLRDLARARSKAEGRRVTVNEIAVEALRKLAF